METASFKRNSHLRHSSYFQPATIAPSGMPANRTVVFRGFKDNKIQINTDCRTHMIDDLNHCPFAEFLINGVVDVIDGSNPDPMKLQHREKAWFASSPKSRLQYLGPNPEIPSLAKEQTQVDYLNLKSNEQIAFSKKISNEEISWNSDEVNK